MYVCVLTVLVKEPSGIRRGTGVTDSDDPLCGDLAQIDPLQEQELLLAVHPSLQSCAVWFYAPRFSALVWSVVLSSLN